MEFTGERVIPGLVNVDLWNEHFSRYLFASRFAEGKRVLDAGCGTGYGTAELARTASSAIGLDIDLDAIDFARAHHQAPGLKYIQAAATNMPLEPGSADLVVAFEVIEHLPDWETLLSEVQRILAPGGLFFVSTPSKDFYRQTRSETGPNPYHHHEFTFGEFRPALERFFSHISLLLQDHVAGIAFRPEVCSKAGDSWFPGEPQDPDASNFFLAICSSAPIDSVPPFVYLPSSANLLKERNEHIERLRSELVTKDRWLAAKQAEHSSLVELHDQQTIELRERNLWAESLNQEIRRNRERILALQTEAEEQSRNFTTFVNESENLKSQMEAELVARTNWAENNEQNFQACLQRLQIVEADLQDRTAWAFTLDKQVAQLRAQLDAMQSSRWVRLGRKAGLGPKFPAA